MSRDTFGWVTPTHTLQDYGGANHKLIIGYDRKRIWLSEPGEGKDAAGGSYITIALADWPALLRFVLAALYDQDIDPSWRAPADHIAQAARLNVTLATALGAAATAADFPRLERLTRLLRRATDRLRRREATRATLDKLPPADTPPWYRDFTVRYGDGTTVRPAGGALYHRSRER